MIRDLRFALRMLLRQKSFTTVTVLTLALGIGANIVIFSIVDGVLLRPLPYREPQQLARIWETNDANATEMTSISNLLVWREQNRLWQDLAAWHRLSSLTLTSQIPAVELRASLVSANYFSVLGVAPTLGRSFAPQEAFAPQAAVAVISHSLWLRLFNASTQVTTANVHLEGKQVQIIGVMPPDFTGPAGEVDIWLPFSIRPGEGDRGQTYLEVVGRLKPEVSPGQAQAELDGIAAELARQFPGSNRGRGLKLVPLDEHTVGNVRLALWILFGAVAMVLLIACANVANLFLVRAAHRQHEIAVRAALGASGKHLARLHLTEAMLIAAAGGAIGLVSAMWVLDSLKALAPSNLPRLNEIGVDYRTLLFTAMVAFLTGVLSGLAPALYALRVDLTSALKDGHRGLISGRPSRQRLQSALVVAQIALALMLLTGAGLLTRNFIRLVNIDSGFRSERVLIARLFLGQRYEDNVRRVEYFRELTSRLGNLPGVAQAGAATVVPLNPFGIDFDVPYHRLEEPEPSRSAAPKAKFRSITPGYLQAIGIPLVAGRHFVDRDQGDSPRVVIVNQALASRAWPHENAVGKRLRFSWADWQTYEVVGIAANVRSYGAAMESQPELFVPHAQIPYTVMGVVVRTDVDPQTLVDVVRDTILTLDANQPPHSIVTMNDLVARSTGRERFALTWLGALAALALVLSTVGLYSIVSYLTTQRRSEIGLRLALGAQRRDILRLAIGRALTMVLAGILLGIIGALALTPVMGGMVGGVVTTDWLNFAFVSTSLLVAALLACYLPAHRAMNVDPLIALRNE